MVLYPAPSIDPAKQISQASRDAQRDCSNQKQPEHLVRQIGSEPSSEEFQSRVALEQHDASGGSNEDQQQEREPENRRPQA